jgi:hypothetical protein
MNNLAPGAGVHLLLVLATPLLGALNVWLLSGRGRAAVRQSALVTAILTLVISGWLVVRYLASPEAAAGEPYAVVSAPWLVGGIFDVRLSLGLDGLSIWLFGLSALLSLTAVLVSWDAIEEKPAGFYALLLLLEAAMLGVFAARDVILFYVFFEFTLVPLFFLIGIWGHDDRRRAAVKFFIYTLAGSVLAFLGLLTIVLWNASHTGTVTFDIAALTAGTAAHPLRQRRPRRRAPQDRHLRLPAVLAADAPRRDGSRGPVALRARRGGHPLWGARGPPPDRSQAADRLFLGEPHGLHRDGPVRAGAGGGGGGDAAADQPRHLGGRALRAGRHDL